MRVPPPRKRALVRSVRRYRADKCDEQRRDEEEEHDREKCGEVERGRSAGLGEDPLERAHERLRDPVEARNQRLIRVRAEQLEHEPQEKQDLEDREEKGDHACDRPDRVVARDGRAGRSDVHVRVRCRGTRVRGTLDCSLTLIAVDSLGGVVVATI